MTHQNIADAARLRHSYFLMEGHSTSIIFKKIGPISSGHLQSGGLASAFSSFSGKVLSTSLGIAETDTTRSLSQKDGRLSKAYFREYVIPADKPSSMRLGFQDVSSFYVADGVRYDSVSASCSGAISFTPRAGEDYEAAFVWEGKACRLSVNQVVSKERGAPT